MGKCAKIQYFLKEQKAGGIKGAAAIANDKRV